MPLRDILLTSIVFGSLPFCFLRPYIGVLVWSWLAFMNPQQLAWGVRGTFEFSQMVAIATLLGLVFTKDRRSIPLVGESIFLAALWAQTVLSTVFALYPDEAWKDFNQFSKILLMAFVTVLLCQDRAKLRYLLLVAALSIGYYGLKGGIWTLLTGGEDGWVLGPPRSFIGDNNGLSLGLNMTLPLLFYLGREEKQRWLRILLYATFGLSILSVLMTYSRAGFLGLVIVLLFLVARTRGKLFTIAVVLAGTVAVVSFLPERWFERISTIKTYTEDASAMSRLYAWELGWRIALDSPLVGGGFRVFGPEMWTKYLPQHEQFRNVNAHSIYFHILGEHGFPGLLLLLGLVASALLSLWKIRRDVKDDQDASWLLNYCYMVEAGLLAFLVTGAFQNLTYFDLFYFLISITIIVKQLATEFATSTVKPLAAVSQIKPGTFSFVGAVSVRSRTE